METQRLLAGRDASIDVIRGVIVVLMALDHTRVFFTEAQFDPVSITDTTPGYFVTRWLTHLCAPGFFFLAGIGVSLSERAGTTPAQSSWWLVTRGLWLMLLEITVIAFAWSFNPGWSWFGVIWSLGISMVALGALRWLPKSALGVTAGAVVVLHNSMPLEQLFGTSNLLTILYSAGYVTTPLGEKLVLFPMIPWLAVMTLGYVLGEWLTPGRRVCVPRSAVTGAACIAIFVLLRTIGVGQPDDGGAIVYDNNAQSLMSFLNVEKYPPSLQFVLATIGVLLVATAGVSSGLQGANAKLTILLRPLLLFGRLPFFFYLMHLYVIHILALLAASIWGWPSGHLIWQGPGPNLVPPIGYGVGLAGVYGALAIVLLVLYVLCKRYDAFRTNRRSAFLRYI
jgi:uncharacterized membrane protein